MALMETMKELDFNHTLEINNPYVGMTWNTMLELYYSQKEAAVGVDE